MNKIGQENFKEYLREVNRIDVESDVKKLESRFYRHLISLILGTLITITIWNVLHEISMKLRF